MGVAIVTICNIRGSEIENREKWLNRKYKLQLKFNIRINGNCFSKSLKDTSTPLLYFCFLFGNGIQR